MSKKLIKSTGVALAATAVVLGQQIVEAEEVTPVTSVPQDQLSTEAPSTTESEQATHEQVDAAKVEYDTAQADQAAQQEVVNQAQTTVNESEKALKVAETEVTTAEEQIKLIEAAPEFIAEKEKAIEEQNSVVTQAENKLEELKKATKLAEAEKKTAEAEKNTAEEALEDAENALKGTGIDTAEQTVADLETQINSQKVEVTQLETEISNKEKELETAKQELTNAEKTATENLNNEISDKEVKLADKKKELDSLPETTSVVGENKIVLPSTYKSTAFPALQKIEATGYTGHPSYNVAADQYKTTIDTASQLNAYGFYGSQNQYKSIEADKSRPVDPSNLSVEVQNELAQFSAAILNDVRTELGLPKVTVTKSAQEFAKKVVDAYNQKNVAFLTHDDVHYKVAQQMGLSYYDNRGYESLGYSSGATSTVDDLKRLYYNSIVYFLFNDSGSNFGHTISMLQSGSSNYYLGVNSRIVDSKHQTQFYMVPEANIQSTSFSKTDIGGNVVDNTTRINTLKTEIQKLEEEISKLEETDINTIPAVKAAKDEVTRLQNELTALKTELVSTKTSVSNLESQKLIADKKMQELQSKNQVIVNEVNKARETLNKANEKLENKQSEYETALEEENKQVVKVNEEKQKIVDLENEIEERKQLVKKETDIRNKKTELETKVTELKVKLEKDKKALEEAEKLLEEKANITQQKEAEYLRLLDLYNNSFITITLPNGNTIQIPKNPSTSVGYPSISNGTGYVPVNNTSNGTGNDTGNTSVNGAGNGTGNTSVNGAGNGTGNTTSNESGNGSGTGTVQNLAFSPTASQTQSAKEEKTGATLPNTGADSGIVLTVVGLMGLVAAGRKSRKREFE
ncbi:TPA: SEC10/PgrA surface exclusion domain-containing protein [Streptococcus suis]|nr:SEC10/PgrA surface exclusion domain-containing protein [Streptococcus suis]